MSGEINVTDHAMLRWLERVEKIDMEAVRARIATVVGRAHEIGAPFVTHDGCAIILEGAHVVTVLAPGQRPKAGRNGKAHWKGGWR